MPNNETTKHTPGPWYIDGIGGIQMDGIRDGYMVNSAEHRRIAVIYGSSSVPRGERWPNVRLIAAAPDLLAAAKAVLAYAAEIEHYPSTGNVYDELGAAVARAEGKEHAEQRN